MGKMPSNLKTKEPVTQKRIKSIPEDYAERRKKYEELKQLRQIMKEKKKKTVQNLINQRKSIEEKKRRKEINMIKSGGYDIIKNTMKIKKWKKKARAMLQKLPPEIFYENSK